MVCRSRKADSNMLLHRAAPAVALRKGKSQWLFDCGEDTQRQLLKQALVRIAVK